MTLVLILIVVTIVIAAVLPGPAKLLALVPLIILGAMGFHALTDTVHHYAAMVPTRSQITQMLQTVHGHTKGRQHFSCSYLKSNHSLYSICKSRHK